MTLMPDVERVLRDAVRRDQQHPRRLTLRHRGTARPATPPVTLEPAAATSGARSGRSGARGRWNRTQCLAAAIATAGSLTAVAAAVGVIAGLAPDAHVRLPIVGSHRSAALADYRGKTVVVTFYATWCAPCRAEARILDRLGKKMRAAGTGQAILIDERDPAATAQAFANKAGLSMAILSDPEGAIATAYGIPVIPATFILNRAGQITTKLLGTTNAATLSRDVAQSVTSVR